MQCAELFKYVLRHVLACLACSLRKTEDTILPQPFMVGRSPTRNGSKTNKELSRSHKPAPLHFKFVSITFVERERKF